MEMIYSVGKQQLESIKDKFSGNFTCPGRQEYQD
jgi:hypothetical protein